MQHQVRTRSDVMKRLARIGRRLSTVTDLASTFSAVAVRRRKIPRDRDSAEFPWAFSVRPILNPCSIGFIPGSTG